MHYLHWGAHTATNDYSDVRKVLLLGLHFLPRPAGHAAAGAALDLNLVDEHPTEKQINETRLGLLKDATLQAVLRGHARVGVDGDCGEMEVVIPMTKQTGLSRDDLLSLFPGAEVVDDHTLMPRKELRGRLRDLATVVEQRLAAGETEMTDQSLYKALGVDRRNFSVLVRRPAWLAHSEALGLEHVRLKGNQRGLRVTRDAPPLSMS